MLAARARVFELFCKILLFKNCQLRFRRDHGTCYDCYWNARSSYAYLNRFQHWTVTVYVSGKQKQYSFNVWAISTGIDADVF